MTEADIFGCWVNTSEDIAHVSIVAFQGSFTYLYKSAAVTDLNKKCEALEKIFRKSETIGEIEKIRIREFGLE